MGISTQHRAVRMEIAFLLAVLVFVAVGCKSRDAGAGAPASPSMPASSPAQPPPAPATERPVRRNGLVGMMFHLAHEQDLTAAQKATIGTLEDQLRSRDASGDDDFRGLESDLAAGIRTDKIDNARMAADFAAVEAAINTHHDLDAEALNALHGALDPSRRKGLVATARTMRAVHSLKPPGSPNDRQANWTRRRLDRLTDELGLDPEQQTRVAALLAASGLPTAAATAARKAEQRRRDTVLLSAFEKDDFDAKKVANDAGPEKSPVDLVKHEVLFLSQILSVLKPAQRERLAATRERPAPDGPHAPAGESLSEDARPQHDDNGPGER